MAEDGEIEVGGAEASLYGLFWFLAALAESERFVLAIDDAHWSDTARSVSSVPGPADSTAAGAARPRGAAQRAGSRGGDAARADDELEVPKVRPLAAERGRYRDDRSRTRLGGAAGAEVAALPRGDRRQPRC